MVLENRVAFAQSQLIKRDELRSRWQYATEEEFYDLFESDKLQAFRHVKGPINDVIFCVPGMYDTGFNNIYWGGFDYCLLSEVEQCEKEYPDFLGNVGIVAARNFDIQNGEVVRSGRLIEMIGEISPAHHEGIMWDELQNEKKDARIAELEAQLIEAQAVIAKLQESEGLDFSNEWDQDDPEAIVALVSLGEEDTALELIRKKDARIAELETQLAAAREAQLAAVEPTTTVDAAKWENSVRAVLEIWAEIVQGDKTNWKEAEFRTALAEHYSDYHTKVHSLAWSLLPGAFKHGRGRPKRNPEKSQQSDNP